MALTTLEDLPPMPRLKEIAVGGVPQLKSLIGCPPLVEDLRAHNCDLENLNGLSNVKQLKILVVVHNPRLESLDGLPGQGWAWG